MTYPKISAIVKEFGLLAHQGRSKRYGQNFIFDEMLLQRIAALGDVTEKSIVLEIGPGPGGLTRALLALNPGYMVAVEYDPDCIRALSYLTPHPHFHLVHQDALKVKLSDVIKLYQDGTGNHDDVAPITIVANLPYNIGSQLLMQWFSEIGHIHKMVLMFQREVALRLIAPPSSTHYGRLSVITQLLCDVAIGLDVPASVFTPPPKVDSCVVQLTPKNPCPLTAHHMIAIENLTRSAFGQRRKQIKTSLKPILGNDTETVLTTLGLDPTWRAENLSPLQYYHLALHSPLS